MVTLVTSYAFHSADPTRDTGTQTYCMYMDRGGNLKETVLRDFRLFLEDNKLYLGPICMNRQKRFRKIFRFLKDICKHVCQHSR